MCGGATETLIDVWSMLMMVDALVCGRVGAGEKAWGLGSGCIGAADEGPAYDMIAPRGREV